MNRIVAAILLVAFMLPTATSHAINPRGSIAAIQITGLTGVTGYTLVGLCRKGTRIYSACQRQHSAKSAKLDDAVDRCLDNAKNWAFYWTGGVKVRGYTEDAKKGALCRKNYIRGIGSAKDRKEHCLRRC